jgi:hypothetical protein
MEPSMARPKQSTSATPPELLAALTSAAEAMLQNLSTYEELSRPRGYRLTETTAVLLRQAEAAVFQAEQALRGMGFGPHPFDCPKGAVWSNDLSAGITAIREVIRDLRAGGTADGCPARLYLGPDPDTKRPRVWIDRTEWHTFAPQIATLGHAVKMLRAAAQATAPTNKAAADKFVADRITLDPDTRTITLDRIPYPIDNPKTFALFQVIVENRPAPITRRELQTKVNGCKGQKTIRALLDLLPEPVRNTVESGPSGYSFNADGRGKRAQRTTAGSRKTRRKSHT